MLALIHNNRQPPCSYDDGAPFFALLTMWDELRFHQGRSQDFRNTEVMS